MLTLWNNSLYKIAHFIFHLKTNRKCQSATEEYGTPELEYAFKA